MRPVEPRAYTLFAQALDRSGYARATLAPRPGMVGEVPPMDPRPVRSMADMGMTGTGMAGMSGMDMAGMKMPAVKMSGMNMSGMNTGGGAASHRDLPVLDAEGEPAETLKGRRQRR